MVWYAHGGGGNGNSGIAMRRTMASPQRPTVGAGSSQCEDSPAHLPPCVYHPRICAVPSPYHRRYILGFRLKAKSEHEATHVFGWYGVGVGMVYHTAPSFATAWESTGTANGRITTRHAASLRTSRIGRIGFKPPYSKRENAAKGPYGSIFFGLSFPSGKPLSITQFHFSKNVVPRRAASVKMALHF